MRILELFSGTGSFSRVAERMGHETFTVDIDMIHGSLFTGIGGIDLGFERAGIKTIWQVENDGYATKVLEKNFPRVRRYKDIRTINWSEVERPDIISGGFPCQDISNAGKKAGIKEGTRSGLWFEFIKAIGVLQPRYVLIENVSALPKRGLDIVLAGLAKEGYDAEWFDLRASDFGALHRRERIFILAYSNRDRLHTFREDGRKIQKNKEQHMEAIPLSGIQSSFESLKDGILEYVSNSPSEGLEGCFNQTGQIARQGIWEVEPELGRVADGVPNRVDRIKCLGNAVVPQVAEYIGRCLVEFDRVQGKSPTELLKGGKG